jgi:hypothetical protein
MGKQGIGLVEVYGVKRSLQARALGIWVLWV